MSLPNLNFGHEGPYIWAAYVLSALVLAVLTLDSLLRARRWKREAERSRPSEDAR